MHKKGAFLTLKPLLILTVIILIIPILHVSYAQTSAGVSLGPHELIKSVSDKLFSRIKNSQTALRSDNKLMRQIVEQELMPHVDHTYSALYVLGTHAMKTEKPVLKTYVDVFEHYLVTTYEGALKYYQQQEVVLLPTNIDEDKSMVSIKALIKEPGKPDIQVVFKVRRTKDEQWKAFDMIVEGVSMLHSKKAEFADILRKQGVSGLTTLLQEKAA